jgi:hypothetical protein
MNAMEKAVINKVMDQLIEKAKNERLLRLSGIVKSSNPGEMVLKLGSVKRQILKDLKSDDIKDIRPDSIRL